MTSKSKICYLHIGTHKTGSTSIQRCLGDTFEHLNKYGILVPSMDGIPTNEYHLKISMALRSLPKHEGKNEILKNLGSKLRNEERDIIISEEVLSEKITNPEVLAKVKDYFAELGYSLHVIVYLRDQASYINSRYVQDVKRFKYAGSFEERLEDILSRKRSSYNYWNHYRSLMLDPDIKFIPRSFSKAIKTGLIEDFFSNMSSLANASWIESYKDYKAQNLNAGVKTVFAARLISNSINSTNLAPLTIRLFDVFKGIYNKKNWHVDPFIGLDNEMAKRIASHFAEGNDKLAMKYWNCKWSDLNPPKSWEPKAFDFASASRQEQKEIMRVVTMLMCRYGKPNLKPKPKSIFSKWFGRKTDSDTNE